MNRNKDVTLIQIKELKNEAELKIAQILYDLEESTSSLVNDVHCLRENETLSTSPIKNAVIDLKILL